MRRVERGVRRGPRWPNALRDDDHHLAERLVGFHPAVRIAELVQRKHAIDNALEKAGFEQAREILAERRCRVRLIFYRSTAKHASDDADATREDTAQIERGCRA